jgi:hypothetical protein
MDTANYEKLQIGHWKLKMGVGCAEMSAGSLRRAG